MNSLAVLDIIAHVYTQGTMYRLQLVCFYLSDCLTGHVCDVRRVGWVLSIVVWGFSYGGVGLWVWWYGVLGMVVVVGAYICVPW